MGSEYCDVGVLVDWSYTPKHLLGDIKVRWENPPHYERLAIADEVASQSPTLEQRFLDQAQQWEDETGHLSSPSQRMVHPSYQAIIGMAQAHKDEMIRLMIKDMKESRRHWFWALSYLTQDNPIKPEDAGRIDRMIDAWVRWEKSRRQP
jgi:hypothetical protein